MFNKDVAGWGWVGTACAGGGCRIGPATIGRAGSSACLVSGAIGGGTDVVVDEDDLVMVSSTVRLSTVVV